MNYQWGKDIKKNPAVHIGQTGFLNFFYLSETDILIYPK